MNVQFILVVRVIARASRAERRRVAARIVNEIGGDLRISSEKIGVRRIVVRDRSSANIARTQSGIERGRSAADAERDEIKIVGQRRNLTNRLELTAELENVRTCR